MGNLPTNYRPQDLEYPARAKDRYVVTDGDGDETYCTQVHDQTNGRDSMLGPNFSVAESEIIAWALNRIAEGRVLIAVHPEDRGPHTTYPYEIYAGAEEGVRS